MNKFFTLICLLMFVSAVNSQSTSNLAPANTSSSTPATKDPKKEVKTTIEIPPEKAAPVNVPKIGIPINIDGKIDEEAWKTAAVFKDFYQTSPGNNIAPSKPTEVYMMYDERHLYIAFKCFDEKDKIRATIAKRDDVFGEDNVRVWLDTYDDRRRAYVLGFNPHGIQQDGIFTEGQGADFSIDLVMESKGVIEDWGWSVEVKLPFKSLRYSAGKGKSWGFNAARNIDRFNDEFDQWMPDDRNISGFLIKSGRITGMDGIKFERTLELVPSITGSQTGRRTQVFDMAPGQNFGSMVGDRWVNNPIKQDIGITVKYTLSPNVTLDAAYNPDFAEIEADSPVITANQRFPIFFQEKRPFFLESAEIFQTPLAIYHSRTIVDPDFAAKLTGKIDRNSFGLMIASDKAPGNFNIDERNNPLLQPAISEFLDKNATFGVFRLKRDVGKEDHIGFFATYRSFPEQKNFLASFDAAFKLSPKLKANFQVVGTTARRCFFENSFEPEIDLAQAQRNSEICGTGRGTFDPANAESAPSVFNQYRTGNALGYYANFDYTTDTRGWFAEVGGRTKDFRADVGFTRRTDTNFAFFYNRISSKSKPKGKIIRANWGQFTGIDYDWSGRLQSFRVGSNLGLSLQRTMFLFFEGGVSKNNLYEEEFGLKRMPTRPGRFFGEATRSTWQHFMYAEINQNLNKHFYYYVWLNVGNNSYDFFFPAPVPGQIDPGPGRSMDGEIFLQWKPIDPLRTSISYRKSRLVRNDNRIRSFDSDIVSVKTTYQFTRFIFARVRLDYLSDESNYAGQALFGWTPSPGTAFYLGYNDNFNYNGVNPNTGQFEPGVGRNQRTFFVRASYLFRKSF
ncbi:MAG TPA: carbohydrate binding family 9 domain-containing protein [Pyrinomonadaceae bacterium]|jgi:hypothetical protein|nr:carbohydrate binding family 9 domain-containing protein [Pyrinomonadaceae bacterium]